MDDFGMRMLASRVADKLEGRKRLLFITGAGLSAEAGLPTYRGVGGMYTGITTEAGVPVEQVMSGSGFQKNPEAAWAHIARMEKAVRGVKPSAAHTLLAELEEKHEVLVLTQNVDGLHRLAGSKNVIEIHGDYHQILCTGCARRELRDSYEGFARLPRCSRCLAILRPDVVLFEEKLCDDKLAQLRTELRRGFDAYFTVGTTALFPYIFTPIILASRRGQLTVEINPEPTVLSPHVQHRFPFAAGVALAAIFRR